MMILDGYSTKNNLKLEDYSVSLSEGLSAVADQTWLENPTSAISRLVELNKATATYEPGMVGDFKPEKAFTNWQSKEKADKAAKEAGVKLSFADHGISQEKLDILISRKREETKRQAIESMAPQGFLPGAAKIGTSLAVSIADPLNVASAFIPVVSQANAIRLGSRFGVTGGRLATGAIEGAVGAAIVEPLVYSAMTAEQADYSLYDSYMNIAFGVAIGGGLHAGLGALGDRLRRSSAQAKADLLQAATGQALDGQPINVSNIAGNYRLIDPYTAVDIDKIKSDALSASKSSPVAKRTPNGIEIDNDALAKSIDGQDTPIAGRQPDAENRVLSAEEQKVIDEQILRANDDILSYRTIRPDGRFYTPEADPKAAIEASLRIESYPEEKPESVDALTNDIITSLDDMDIDTTTIKSEIADINTQIERESNGLREAILCRIG